MKPIKIKYNGGTYYLSLKKNATGNTLTLLSEDFAFDIASELGYYYDSDDFAEATQTIQKALIDLIRNFLFSVNRIRNRPQYKFPPRNKEEIYKTNLAQGVNFNVQQ